MIPIFLIMALGYLARSLGAIKREDVPRLNKLAFRYFMPVMLFYSIYKSDLETAVQPRVLLFAAGCVLLEYLIALGYVLLTEKDNSKRGVMIQGLYRSNFVIIGIPLAEALAEGADISPVVVMIAIVVPMFNVLAVVTLESFNGNKPKIGKLLLDIATNPLILGAIAGILALLVKLRLPSALESAVSQIYSATNPLMLFLLGAFFKFDGVKKYAKELVTVCIGRLIVFPGIFLTIAMLVGINGAPFAGLIAVFGSAAAIASFVMAEQMGGDAELAGDIVVLTSAFCAFTMFLWALLFKNLGVF